MKFKKVLLYTHKLEEEKKFYTETIGLELLESTANTFTVKVGWSTLTFKAVDKKHMYHYCFLIPSNQLNNALDWIENRTTVIEIENGRKTQRFESWNADSFYFYDASGNIAEFIVRHDLKNEKEGPFDTSMMLCVNEMGMPTKEVEKINTQMELELKTKFWKGDLQRFGTNGSQEGIWLMPNYEVKETWFPTDIPLRAEDFEAVVENEEQLFQVIYSSERLKISKLP